MKSLMISCTYFPPQTGGISHMMASIASALGPENVCCLTAVSSKISDPELNLLPRVYRRPRALAGSSVIQAASLCATVAEIMLRENPRVVQLSSADEGYLGLFLRRWLNLPFVIYAHGNEVLSAIQSEWPKPRVALQQASAVFANSRFTADLVTQAEVAHEKIHIVHPGCDTRRFRPLVPREDLRVRLLGDQWRKKVILTVGGLVARKGHDMIIRALARGRKSLSDATYLIVGDGPSRGDLENLASELGVRSQVVFAGKIRGEELPDVYALSDVFVMTSRSRLEHCDVEGFGLVFLEANACGKPVVAGRSGGVSDAVVDGVTGLIVDPLDCENIAGALDRLLSDSDLSSRLGRLGRERAVRDFDWARTAARVQEILEMAAENE